jgi:hypothetical protein
MEPLAQLSKGIGITVDRKPPSDAQRKGAGVARGVWVVIVNWTARFASRRREVDEAWTDPGPGLSAVIRGLHDAGFDVDLIYGFPSVTSILWDRLAQVLDLLRRPDLADRARVRMRHDYVATGGQAAMSPFLLIKAHAGGASQSEQDTKQQVERV